MQMKKPSTNPSLSQFGDTFRNGSEVLSKSTATVKKLIANNLKHHLLENDSKNNHTNKNHQSFSFYEGASQDFIPIKNIQDEMIITKDGRYLSVIEILPINFFQKSKESVYGVHGNIFLRSRKKHARQAHRGNPHRGKKPWPCRDCPFPCRCPA